MRSLSVRYRFLRRLGSGAAGGVHLVEDRVQGGPPIALKLLERSSDPAFRSSFAREFAVLSSLSLPGVAQVYDLGSMPSGQEVPEGPFFTRAFVDGKPLDDWARHAELEQSATLLVRVMELVSRLHRMGIVHGDLKPANIVIDHEGAPNLIDFGLSSRLGGFVDAGLSGSGTPLFMAPELFRGSEPSIASDVYALGATAWTLATGRLPFAELGGGALQAKLNGELPQHDAGSGLQEVLLQAALAALSPDRRLRVPSADELAAMIERGLRRSSRPPSVSKPTAVFVPPRPRGRENQRDELEQTLQQAGVAGLCGARGMGKSSLLRELKWRAQLEGRVVLELRFRGEASSGLEQLKAQQAAEEERSADVVEALLAILDTGEGEQRALLLVDDFELADAEFARALPLALYELGERGPAVVVGCSEATNPRLLTLSPRRVWTLEALTPDVLAAIVREVIGSAETLLVDALVDHAAGNPGLLVEALAQVFVRPDITANEVAQLRSGEIGSGLQRIRFRQLSTDAQRAFALLVAARAGRQLELPAALFEETCGESWAAVRGELAAQRLVSEVGRGYRPNDSVLSEWLRHAEGELLAHAARHALSTAASVGLHPALVAELAYSAGDRQRLYATVKDALDELRRRGALQQALELAQVALPGAPGALGMRLRLAMAELQEGLGELEGCVSTAEGLLADGSVPTELSTRARLVAGRAHVARGNLAAAAQVLSVLSEADSGELFAPACRELARVHLRRGDREQAARVVAAGLAACAADHPARPELVAIDAYVAAMAGDRVLATAKFDEALALASAAGSARDQAQLLGYRAMAFERAGELSAAAKTYEQALVASRSAGDIGLTGTYASNYGNVSFRLGHTDLAAEHYAIAGRFLRRAGRFGMAVMAQNNLANLHLHLGSFERAQALAETSLADSERWHLETTLANALQILGDIAARQGHTDRALAHYDASAGHYERVARRRELAEVCLDAGECLLDRAGASDASAASARLARARSVMEAEGIEDLRTRLKLLLARARAANGDLEGALADLERLASLELKEHERELGWQVLAAQAQLHRLLGSEILARKSLMDAAEIIEREAARVPREVRDGFRAVPRRRAVIDGATATASLTTSRFGANPGSDGARSLNARLSRLLEIIKRLARERDLSRLLERITDAAVELSGAERGFVLLLDDAGQLAPHTVRASAGREQDPSVAFSRSIAEAVLIDGEPIVTVNARDDRRVNEFMSVHKLALKSVACVPIRGPEQVVGVLYLEHRMRAGRFQDEDLDLLLAFADQAAIALENTRLWQENETRRAALEAKNGELEAAKADIERLLEARTEELQEAQRALQGARSVLAQSALKHGMVGQGAAMQRVFSLIERVRDSAVPVVIQGESGTGKELVARAIHAAGARQKAPFVAVNCGALPENLIESELFGHVRGAFTGADRDKKGLFALAQGGTLFLDEFADVPPRMQLDLLRVLQEGRIRPVGSDADQPIDVRVVVAANRPLADLMKEKRLREDLFYRLSVVEIRLPSLRERGDDLPLLCDHLLARIATQHGGRPKRLTRAAFDLLAREPFPGNVRQLEHMLLSAAMMTEGASIDVRDLPSGTVDAFSVERTQEARFAQAEADSSSEEEDEELAATRDLRADGLEPSDDGRAFAPAPSDLRGFKQRERQRILDALERHGWNRVKAATALGMPRRTFYRRLSEFGIL